MGSLKTGDKVRTGLVSGALPPKQPRDSCRECQIWTNHMIIVSCLFSTVPLGGWICAVRGHREHLDIQTAQAGQREGKGMVLALSIKQNRENGMETKQIPIQCNLGVILSPQKQNKGHSMRKNHNFVLFKSLFNSNFALGSFLPYLSQIWDPFAQI